MLGVVLLSVATAVAVTAILVATRRRWPGALAAWVAYLILIGPTSGIVPFGRLRGVVDRYTYVACLGWAMVAGGAFAIGWRAWRDGRAAGFGPPGGRRPPGDPAHVERAQLAPSRGLAGRGDALDARADRRSRVAVGSVKPRDGPRQAPGLRRRRDPVSRGSSVVAGRAGCLPEPRPRPRGRAEARRGGGAVPPAGGVRPGWAEGYLDLGTALYNSGETSEAVDAFTRAVELDPSSVRAHESLGTALWRQGREAEAAEHFRRAAALGSSTPHGHDLAVPRPGADAPGGS